MFVCVGLVCLDVFSCLCLWVLFGCVGGCLVVCGLFCCMFVWIYLVVCVWLFGCVLKGLVWLVVGVVWLVVFEGVLFG